jgi:nucleotide-binding universal stress UspA family protein
LTVARRRRRKKIVVGVDGSEASKHALRWAVDEARLRNARVVAIHAWDAPVLPALPVLRSHPEYVALVAKIRAAAEELVRRAVKDVVGRTEDVDVEAAAIEGHVASVLLSAASKAELLVVGSRGDGGFVDLLLGSVTHQCVSHATCPVLVHRKRRRT